MRVISGNPISTLDNRSLRQRMTSTHDKSGLMVHSMGGRGPPLQRKKTLSKDRKPYAVMVVSAGGVSASAHDPRGTCAPREAPPPRPALPTRLRWHPPTRRRSRRVRLLGDVERGARRLRSLLPSTTTTAATVGAFARALRGRVLTSCRGCRRCSSDEGRGKGCSGDGRGGEARPATGPLPPPTAPGPCTRRRLAAAYPRLRATRWGSRPKRARLLDFRTLSCAPREISK